MTKKTTTQQFSADRRKQNIVSYILWGIIILVAVASLVGFVLRSRQTGNVETSVIPAGGESLPIMSSFSHVPLGDDPGPFNSNPPSSGRMYATQLLAGFYDEVPTEEYGEYPEGYVVHSLEHGYVIFWYNCDLLSAAECNALKVEIKAVMASVEDFKVIGIPWPAQDSPVAMTSWGRRLVFDVFDPVRAEQFVLNFRNLAPEPGAR